MSRQEAPAATPCRLLITADDRTGALESAGACADLGFRARLAKAPLAGDEVIAVDIDSRHVAAGLAASRITEAHMSPAQHRCHKMDSGLRGNWHHEAAALLAAGWRIGIVASYPDAGRCCRDGTVFIHGVPVADSPFGKDPRNALLSSRPLDYLQAAGCQAALASEDAVVLDAEDNAQLQRAARRCLAEERVLVGATGAIAAYAALLREGSTAAVPAPKLPRPALVVCGSLHPLSRAQIANATSCLKVSPAAVSAAERALRVGEDVVLASPKTTETIDDASAARMAGRLAELTWELVRRCDVPALVVFGGDTAQRILGDQELQVLGSVGTGIPLCRTNNGLHVVTKGGGIGTEDSLARLLAQDAASADHQER